MKDLRTITITDGFHTLAIEIGEQLYPDARNNWDEKAYRAIVTARAATRVGSFLGTVETVMMIQDIVALAKALQDIDKQVGKEATVCFGIYEAYLDLKFVLGRTGTLTVTTTLIDDPVPTATLTFDIEADQSYLPTWIENVNRVLSQMEQQTSKGR